MIPEQIDLEKEQATDNGEDDREEFMRRKEASYAKFRVARDRPPLGRGQNRRGPPGQGLPAWT